MATTPDPSDLTDVKAVMAFLGVVSTPDEEIMQRLVTAASRFFVEVIDRPIKPAVQHHVESGKGRDRIFLPVYPVMSVEAVRFDGAAVARATVGGSDEGWLLPPDSNVLVLRGKRTPIGTMNVEVDYTSGYAAVPAHVAQAVTELAATRYRERANLGIASRGLAGESISFAREDLPPSVRLLVDHLRRVVPA